MIDSSRNLNQLGLNLSEVSKIKANRTQQLLIELRELRKTPDDSNWDQVHANQREILDLLKQTPAHDEEMQRMTTKIQEVLDKIPPQH